MENASDALKMAFAVFVFIIALSIVFSLLTKIKETADMVLFHTDKTNYYEWETGTLDNGRVVGEDTIISSLYKQQKELTYISIKGNTQDIEFKPSDLQQARIEYIQQNLNTGNTTYLENITEITTGGEYMVGEDGIKITITPGTTRTYVTYTKIN